MKIADQTLFNHPDSSAGHHKLFIFLYTAFALVFLVLIYAASISPGTSQSDIASMSVFP